MRNLFNLYIFFFIYTQKCVSLSLRGLFAFHTAASRHWMTAYANTQTHGQANTIAKKKQHFYEK